MKKIFTFVAMLAIGLAAYADCQDGPYGLKINDSQVVDAPKFGEPDAQGRVQYKASCVALNAGDKIQLVNQSCDATWMVDIDPYGSYQNFEGGKSANKLTCKVAGSYDFYIKMKENDDLIYIGPGDNCGGGQQGGGGDQGGGSQGGGSVEGNPRYYYKGYIDNQDVEPSEATIFDHGIAEIEFTQHAMLFVLYQVDGQEGVQYMTPEWIDGPRHTTLSVGGNGGYNKWNCPLGTTTLYLYDNGDGTLEISADPIPGKKLADPQPDHSAVENTIVKSNITKTIINGQVVIIKDGVRYNLLGAQLQ